MDIEMVRPRSVGIEQAALSAMRACGLEGRLAQLGLNRPQIAAALWRTYTMLTQLESVFRSLKTDLGLRPV